MPVRRMKNYEITCPYCFGKFHDYEAVFRSNYVAKRGGIMHSGNMSMFDTPGNPQDDTADDSGDDELYRPFDGPYNHKAGDKIDEKLEAFWETKGKAAGFINSDPKWYYPHIDPQSKDFLKMVDAAGGHTGDMDAGEDPNGFVRDQDGFIVGVRDRHRTIDDAAMTRLCPHCHNPLPFTEYGKYPTKFISIVGIRASGKSVYLNLLLNRFTEKMKNSGFIMGDSNIRQEEEIAAGKPLLPSTDDAVMRRPMAACLYNKARNRHLTLVFYDIAGENCVPKSMRSKSMRLDGKALAGAVESADNAVARTIAFCDGLLFLIDPDQIPIFASDRVDSTKDIMNVINVVNQLRPAYNTEHPSWEDIPVACVITKSDRLEGRDLNLEPCIFRHISYERENGKPVIGLNRDEFIKIDRSLRTEFEKNANGITQSLGSFGRHAFFAVSAITCGVEFRVTKYKNSYVLSGDDSEKFRILRDWSRAWESRTVEERREFFECPALDPGGERVMIPPAVSSLDDAVTSLETDITATTYFLGRSRTIHLTLGDIFRDLDLEGYPKADPNPRRIEEPLRWILWQMKEIEPFFRYPVPVPEKGIFESHKKYEERLIAYANEKGRQEVLFYKCEDPDGTQ